MLKAREGQIRGFDVASLLSQLSQGDPPSGGQWLGEGCPHGTGRRECNFGFGGCPSDE